MNLNLRFVLRYLRSPEKSSFSSYTSKLAIIGLSIGVTALMLTASIIRGFENTLSDKLSGFDGMVRVQHMLGHSITSNISVLDSMLGQFEFYLFGSVCHGQNHQMKKLLSLEL